MKSVMVSRATVSACAIAAILLAACESSPTQPAPVVPPPAAPPPPAPPPPPPPPAPPPPPPAPWVGFIGTEAGGFTVINGLSSATQILPAAINDAGQVVGYLFVNSVSHAFTWSRTTGLEDLGTLPGDKESGATGINANGDIVGHSRPFAGNARAIRWSRGNGMTELGGLPYTCLGTWATDINAAGDVVGKCLVDGNQIIYRPFRWTSAKGAEDLGTLDSDRGGVANAINDSGEIAGISNSASYYDDSRAVLWAGPGKAVQVGECIEGWCGTMANAINNNGDVVGSAYGTAFVRWHDGTMRDIGGIAGALYSIAVGINQAGEIVGVSWLASEKRNRAFIWTAGGGIRELTISGKTELMVTGINNKGEIIGYAR